MPELGVIADDATGAAAVAGECARWGLPVDLRCGGSWSGTRDRREAIPVIDLDARGREPAAAHAVARQAAETLRARGCRRLFVKIDSLLRGPVAELLAGATAGFGATSGICAPAFPAAGRWQRGGDLVAERDRLPIAAHAPSGWQVPDIATAADLAEVVRHWPSDAILAGSYGLLGAWARALVVGDRPLLAVIGSGTAGSRRQIAALHEAGWALQHPPIDPTELAAPGAVWCLPEALAAEKREDPASLDALVAAIPAVLPAIGALCLSGGATARAACTACGITHLEPTGWEPLPSVPLLRAVDGPRPGLPVLFKSGSVGDDDAFVALFAALTT